MKFVSKESLSKQTHQAKQAEFQVTTQISNFEITPDNFFYKLKKRLKKVNKFDRTTTEQNLMERLRDDEMGMMILNKFLPSNLKKKLIF